MKWIYFILPVFSFLIFSRADADDISVYAASAGQEVAATKSKLKSSAGIFNEFNYRGTIIRQAKPEDRAPASAEVVEDEDSSD